MPRYVIERQFLVPIYEHVLIEAPSLEEACSQAIDDGELPWGDHSTVCCDSAGPVIITRAVELPNGVLLPEMRPDRAPDSYELSRMTYDAGLEPLEVPPQFADEASSSGPPGFV